MEKWFIKYSVKIEAGGPFIHPIEFGIVCAESFGKAAEKIEDFYGPDLLEILQLKYLTDELMILPEEVMHSVEEALEL